MASPLQIQYHSTLIETRIQNLFLDVKRQYDQGEIKSKTEYLYKLYQAINTFYETIGKPTMQVRLANTTPSSAEYNQTISEIYQDIQTLYEESTHLSTALRDSFQQSEIDRQNLDNQLKRIEDKMKEMVMKPSQSPQEVIFRDSFADQTQFDQEMPTDNLGHIWTEEGVLTLQPRIMENYIDGVTIRIVSGNGLPGNTKQVKQVAGELKFLGEESLHLNLADVLDGNSDTWFEYETFGIHPKILSSTSGLGYEYEEGVAWNIEPGKNLELTLEIELPTMKTINWFSLSPFLPNAKGVAPAKIVSIEIQDGKGGVYHPVLSDSLFNEEKIFLFGKQDCKRIIVSLIQPNGYETEVGHLFYKEIEKQQVNYMDRMKYQSGKRIRGVMPSIENLGLRYDYETKSILYPTVDRLFDLQGLPQIKSNLFMVPRQDLNTPPAQIGFENLPAARYMIGVRDIDLANYQFEATSEYISQPFTASAPIVGVSLETEEDIPPEFTEGDWVAYSISPDNGQSWYRIYPRGATKSGAKTMYLFNTNTPKEGRLDPFGYIDLPDAVTSIRFRIQLERPNTIANAPYYTPIVRDYRLRAITRGEVFV